MLLKNASSDDVIDITGVTRVLCVSSIRGRVFIFIAVAMGCTDCLLRIRIVDALAALGSCCVIWASSLPWLSSSLGARFPLLEDEDDDDDEDTTPALCSL